MKKLLLIALTALSINCKLPNINFKSNPERIKTAALWQSLILLGTYAVNQITEELSFEARSSFTLAALGLSEYWFYQSQPEVIIDNAKKFIESRDYSLTAEEFVTRYEETSSIPLVDAYMQVMSLHTEAFKHMTELRNITSDYSEFKQECTEIIERLNSIKLDLAKKSKVITSNEDWLTQIQYHYEREFN